MKRMILFFGYGAAALTVLFAVLLPIKVLPLFLSAVTALDLKIAPWISGGETAFSIDRGSYQIKVYRPVFPALIGEGSEGFVQLVWQPRSALPARVQEEIDLNGDGTVDGVISFSNPPGDQEPPVLSVDPRSPWILPVQNVKTESLGGVLIEKVRDAIFVRIPIRKIGAK